MCSSLLNTFGLVMGFLGATLLVRFGIAFKGNETGVDMPGKACKKLHLTLERGQRLGFSLLAVGFLFQFISQLL